MQKKTLAILFSLISLTLFFGCNKIATKPTSSIKREVLNFVLYDQNGVKHELYQYQSKKAIVIISQGNDCPIIQKYSSIINEIKNKYDAKNVTFLFLNANKSDTKDSILKEVKEYNFELPVLIDPSQIITSSLGITRTSEAVVITPDGWRIIYRGAISDRLDYGADKQTTKNHFLNDVLDAITSDKPISTSTVPAKGCFITFDNPTDLSYKNVISPVISAKCLNCHSTKGGYKPMLDSYDNFKKWAFTSKENILMDKMPPINASKSYEQNINLSPLTADEKKLLIKWIDNGTRND